MERQNAVFRPVRSWLQGWQKPLGVLIFCSQVCSSEMEMCSSPGSTEQVAGRVSFERFICKTHFILT